MFFSLLIKAFLIEMILFHMSSYDFESFSYEGECILYNFLKLFKIYFFLIQNITKYFQIINKIKF